VVVLDADLQDPPEVVLELAARWREGYDIVYAIRDAREAETRFKRATASWFYGGAVRAPEKVSRRRRSVVRWGMSARAISVSAPIASSRG